MEIKTKYNIGDYVTYISNGDSTDQLIGKIHTINFGDMGVGYTISNKESVIVYEDDITSVLKAVATKDAEQAV